MSTLSPQGQCCVCGAASTQRCSACGKAGFDLFFCSQEHQKPVWYAHKLSRGMGSEKPFRFPPLSLKEVRDVTHLLKNMALATTLERRLEMVLPGASGRLGTVAVIELLSQPHTLAGYSPSATSAAICECYIAGLFGQALRDQARSNGAPLEIDRTFPLADPLYVELHHRILLQAAIQNRLSASTLPSQSEVVTFLLFLRHMGQASDTAADALCAKYPVEGAQLKRFKGHAEQLRRAQTQW
ncbi:hypothetical protein JCM8097_002355 [Rhodosporidiobolus ruineniae]